MEADEKRNLDCLTAPLPEDIEKLKWRGDFDRALKVIDLRLEKDLPQMLKKRLILEKDILERMPLQYPYSWEAAVALASKQIEGMAEEELEALRDEGAIDWLYVNGVLKVKEDFPQNLIKTRPSIRARVRDKSLLEEADREDALRDETIKKMKEQGGLSYYFKIRSTLRIKKEAIRAGEQVRVYLPIPVEYMQVKNFKLLHTSMEPYDTAPAQWPQRTVCFETEVEENQEFSVEYEFENHMKYVELNPREVSNIQLFKGRDFSGWLGEQLPHIHFTLYLRTLVEEVVGIEENPLLKAKKIYDYITSHVMYSFVRSYFTITDITGYAASAWKGDCGVQALLFITMLRIAGVPARWQSGLYANAYDIGCHDWAQFYVEPYGWLYADCSFGGGAFREDKKERREFYFGNLDPFRIPMNSEFGWKFSPFMKYVRNDPYDNQVGEAEYGDRALREQEYETTHEMIEIRELSADCNEE